MVQHTRFNFFVSVRRDPVPGWGNHSDDWKNLLQKDLPPWYDPQVRFTGMTYEKVSDTHVSLEPGPEPLDEFMSQILELLPNAELAEDLDGQIIINTGKTTVREFSDDPVMVVDMDDENSESN